MLVDMNTESLAIQLNSIVDLFQWGYPSEKKEGLCTIFCAYPEEPLTLIGENRQKFQSSVSALLCSLPSVKGTVSKEFIIEKLIPIVRKKKIAGEPFSSSDADDFKRKICDIPRQVYRVFRPIHGVDVAVDKIPVKFGDFIIDFGRNFVVADGVDAFPNGVNDQKQRDQLFIQCSVDAREASIAVERADEQFYRFELIFRFLIGKRTDRVNVGILNYEGTQIRDIFIYSEDGRPVRSDTSLQGALQPFILKDPSFPEPTPAIIRLFELITRPNNDLEKHILRCAEWTGQALSEPNEAAALVKAAIALEVLFRTDEKSVITASIMAQISESCAFLLGSENKTPLDIEREVKRLYGVRSSVVHSGKDTVDSKDLEAFISICRHIVVRLLSDDEFREIDSASKLAEHFRLKKYESFCCAKRI